LARLHFSWVRERRAFQSRRFRRNTMMTFLTATCVWLFAQQASADETWTCTFASSFLKQPMSVTYHLVNANLTQISSTGVSSNLQVMQNNQYGLVAISLISEIEQDQTTATVGAITVVIEKRTKKFWLSTIVNDQPNATTLYQGTCTGH
jgi:hypothetical protein